MQQQPRSCVLCGIDLAGLKRRLFCPVEGGRFITDRCKPSPFLHAFLARGELDCDRKHYLCIPCVNWKRRVVQGSLRRACKPMLQLDRMILFLMQPGRHQEPDMRCMQRLVRAVRQPTNPYLPLFPSPARWIASSISGDTYQHCVLAWWEFNGRTEFFASPQEARRVRCALKAGIVPVSS
jgi:hypothetical protein